jgi:mono/diheme cytochrome c family protein
MSKLGSSKPGSVLAGALSVVLLIALAGGVILMRTHGLTTREAPGPLESWVARRARQMALPQGARDRRNPVADSPAILAAARAHWADHCASCHANNGSGDIELGKRLYPPAPDMRLDATQHLTDGELFYIIQNGIRLTGMPGWGGGSARAAAHGEEDSWKLVRLIRYLPQLTAEEEREMQGLNPKSPDELKEEQEERDFLNGGSSDEHAAHHHH